MKRPTLSAFCLVLALLSGSSMAEQSSVTARLNVQNRSPDLVVVSPCLLATENGEFSYQFRVVKKGQSGRSNSQQGGKRELLAGEEQCLGTVSINLTPDDQAELLLIVYKNGVEVSRLEERLTNI